MTDAVDLFAAQAADINSRAATTRRNWMEVLDRFHEDRMRPTNAQFWSRKDSWSRDQIREVQQIKLRAVVPFLYENSQFYRRRFERLDLIPDDIKDISDLIEKWPVVTKEEMMTDALGDPPLGHYTSLGEDIWRERGWMQFSSSGSSGVPRVFRYTHFDRKFWAQANARALYAGGLRQGDSILMATGYGPHVFAWGVQATAQQMQIPIIPGGGLDAAARVAAIERFKPTVLLCTPSYALHLVRVMQESGLDPVKSSIRLLIMGGEPFSSISGTLGRIQDLWGAKAVEFFGCTEAAPHCGGYSCPEYQSGPLPFIHLMEDIQIWETISPEDERPVPYGDRGLLTCTNLNSESSPQLRFLVGDYTVLDDAPCACGRNHVRAMGCVTGRADDLINLRGIKFFPGQVEAAVRSVAGAGDEFQIHLQKTDHGLDTMKLIVEHAGESAASQFEQAVRSNCEIRCEVEVVPIGTLPKTEHKARRVFDQRGR